MFDTIAGLPVHPLVVHAVVVLAPLTALLLIAYAIKPSWRIGLRWPTIGLALVSAASAFAAVQSGESFEERVGDPAYDHAEAGELAAMSVYVLLAAVLVVVFLLARARRSEDAAAKAGALGVLGLVVALGAAGFVGYGAYAAGHSGAKSVWKGEISNANTNGGEGDGDGD